MGYVPLDKKNAINVKTCARLKPSIVESRLCCYPTAAAITPKPHQAIVLCQALNSGRTTLKTGMEQRPHSVDVTWTQLNGHGGAYGAQDVIKHCCCCRCRRCRLL